MALTDFTTYADVRAALGVSSDELEDCTLELRLYEVGLVTALEEVDETLPDQYMAARSAGAPEPQIVRFVEAVQFFATYVVARDLLPALPMFAFKEVTDGKATDTRFSQDPYKATSDRVEVKFEVALLRLKKVFAGLSGGTTDVAIRSFMAVASPSSDPVTGS